MKSTRVEAHQTTTAGRRVQSERWNWEIKAFWGFFQRRERLIRSTCQGGASCS